MRKTTLNAQEVAELDELKRRETRKRGFSMMSVRDRGWERVRCLSGHQAVVLWHTDRKVEDHEAKREVPEGVFLLDVVIDGKTRTLAFDVDDFRKSIRWA